MEIVVTVFATVVAAGCFFAIVSSNLKKTESNSEHSAEIEDNKD